jgi:hypothetical protein
LSNFSDDNDVPALKNRNGLFTWLADGQKQLKKRLQGLAFQVRPISEKVHGRYKPKGTKQFKQTQQHHTKQAQDMYILA